MPFQKGREKTGGIKKGTKRVKTDQWSCLGDFLCTYGANKYLSILQELEGEEYMRRYESTLEYFKPKLARTENKNENTGEQTINIVHYNKPT